MPNHLTVADLKIEEAEPRVFDLRLAERFGSAISMISVSLLGATPIY
jgi:hypothetical protein